MDRRAEQPRHSEEGPDGLPGSGHLAIALPCGCVLRLNRCLHDIRVGGAAPPAASRCCARASLRAPSRGDPPLKPKTHLLPEGSPLPILDAEDSSPPREDLPPDLYGERPPGLEVVVVHVSDVRYGYDCHRRLGADCGCNVERVLR